MNIKEFVNNNLKLLLFGGGIVAGSLLSMSLMCWTHNLKLVELDLNKIIKAYSVVAAKTEQSPAMINKKFKDQFNHAMGQISPRTIVVSKGCLLSKHEAIDGTKSFIENMELSNKDEKTSN